MVSLNSSPLHSHRFNFWPLALTLVGVLWVCLGLNHFAASRALPDFICQASLYTQQQDLSDSQLSLNIASSENRVGFEYIYSLAGQPKAKVELTGELLGLEVASMTYKLLLDKGDMLLDIAQSELAGDIQQLLVSEPDAERKYERLPVDIQILDIDTENGYSILRFKPGNNIWVCNIQR